MRSVITAKRLLILGALVLVLSTGAPHLSRADDAQELNQSMVRTSQLYIAGKHDDALPVAQRSVALAEKLYGSSHVITANCVNMLAQIHMAKREYEEAERLYKSAIATIEKAEQALSDQFLPSPLLSLAQLYSATNRYAEAIELLKRAAALREKNQNQGGFGMVLDELAKTYAKQGAYREAEPIYLRSIATLEKALGPDDPLIGASSNNLAMLYREQSRYAAAEPLMRRAIALYEKQFGAEHQLVGTLWNNLGEVQAAQGRYKEAEATFKHALGILEKALGRDASDVALAVGNLGGLYHTQRRDAEAEPLLKRALAIDEKSEGADSLRTAMSLNNLAAVYRLQDRNADAELLLKRSLAIREKALGPDHPETGLAVNNLATLYYELKRYGDAERMLQRYLVVSEKAFGPEHPAVALGLNNMAMLYQDLGRLDEAEALLQRALAIKEKDLGKEQADVGTTLMNLAGLYKTQKRYEEALQLYVRSREILEKALGPTHSLLAINLNNTAELFYAQQDWSKAASYWQKSTELLVTRAKLSAQSGGVRQDKANLEIEQEQTRFQRLVKVSHRLAESNPAEAAEIAARMFETAQWAQNSRAARSLAQMAARQAKGDTTMARLIRERQDLVGEWEANDKLLVAAASQEPGKRSAAGEDDLRRRMSAIDKRIAEVDAALAKDFPEYASLASSDPLPLAQVQQLLQPEEALVLFLETPDKAPLPEETFIWAITRTGSRWVRADIGTPSLKREVDALRCGLDLSAWDKGPECEKLLDIPYSKELYAKGTPMPFDLERSYRLYKALFGGIEDLIQDKRLLLVPSGKLTQLPFQVLVTAEPDPSLTGSAMMRGAQWLARSHALTVLPAVASLKALRHFARASTGKKAYMGIGNPLLDGWSPAFASLAREARQKQSCGKLAPLQTRSLSALSRSIRPVQFTRNLANLDQLRAQCPLPETADELCTVAQHLKAGEEDVLLGGKATKANIRSMSAHGALADYRVLHFATHGALAGELRGSAEPGLILNPPPLATDEDDGYLAVSDIIGLKLDADWVILSACNTAAGDSDNAEALSGLARSFFYAGARSLVVSHWSVNTETTVKLITGALGATSADASLPPAEALRRSMVNLIDNGSPQEAHPEYWAPFVLVGEGAAK